MFDAFCCGALLAFGLILPLGVQNIFVFNQGATQHTIRRALPAALTAFACDTVLILSAVLGVSMLVLTLPILKTVIVYIGILFLSYMGYITWNTTSMNISAAEPLPIKKQIAFALTVSLLNPHALLDTIGIIGTNSLSFYGTEKYVFTLACLCVSLCWFVSLSMAGHYFKKLDNSHRLLIIINKISAVIMWGTAVALYINN